MARTRVTLHPTASGDPWTWYSYQRYYLSGLRQLADVDLHIEAPGDALFIAGRDRGFTRGNAVWRRLSCRRTPNRYVQATHVGRYTFQFPGGARPLRVAIDTHDTRHIRDPEALDWAELYFKVSYWPTLDYGPKVRPLVCGNGNLWPARIAHLKRMRGVGRDLDLAFVAKLWPSNPADLTYWNPVEHLVRVFETLARLPVRSYLRAIVPKLTNGEPFPRRYVDRLVAAGVPLIGEGDNIGAEELWDVTARSKLAFLRPGKHLCVSWRMIDHLALGATTLCDNGAYPQWPVPLREGVEYFDAHCGIGPDESLPDPADYGRIEETVMSLLADPERLETCRRAAAAYFDEHVDHPRLARHIVDQARSVARKASDIRPVLPPARESASPPKVPIETVIDIVDSGVHPAHTSLLEFTNDAVIVWEKDGRGILYWNRAAEALYGFTREEAQGRTTHTLLRTRPASEGVQALERGLERHGMWVGELCHTHKSGAKVFVEARLALLSQVDGNWLVLEVNRDISDRKAAEAWSEKMSQQLEHLQRLSTAPDSNAS